MCRLGRALRSGDEDEGRGEEGGGGAVRRKNRVDKSRGIETHTTEAFLKVRPTDPFVCVSMFTPSHKLQWSIQF